VCTELCTDDVVGFSEEPERGCIVLCIVGIAVLGERWDLVIVRKLKGKLVASCQVRCMVLWRGSFVRGVSELVTGGDGVSEASVVLRRERAQVRRTMTRDELESSMLLEDGK
jgi:hypothetical protein